MSWQRRLKQIISAVAAAVLLTGCSGTGTSSGGPLTPDQVFSGGSPDIEGYQRPSTMLEMSSQQLVTNIRIGWNLGNSLESCISDLDGDATPDIIPTDGETPDETFWGNPIVSEQLFRALTDSGINAVRLPITWRGHIDEDGNIDETWLNRVQQVVDFAYNCGMYVIITVYHDGAADKDFGAWIRSADDDYDGTFARYKTLWTQISDRFRTYNERLLFESMNEVEFPYIDKDRAYALLNDLNQTFLDTVRSTGGNNTWRHLVIAGYAADVTKTCDPRFHMPDDPVGKSILSLHYYNPLTFCKYGIQNYWGIASQQEWMTTQINEIQTTFVNNGIPVIISEYGTKGSDKASRVFFCEMLTKLCRDRYISTFLWDDGSEFDRTTYTWRDPELISALKHATSGNSYVPRKISDAAGTSDEAPEAPADIAQAGTAQDTAETPAETFQS